MGWARGWSVLSGVKQRRRATAAVLLAATTILLHSSICAGGNDNGDDQEGAGRRRELLGSVHQLGQPIRVASSLTVPSEGRDCRAGGEVVRVGSPQSEQHLCSSFVTARGNLHTELPSDCWRVCGVEDVLGEEQRVFLERAAHRSLALLSSAVAVLPLRNALRLSDLGLCTEEDGVAVPQELDGTRADLFVVLSVRPQPEGQRSASRVCAVDATRRATVAHVTLSPALVLRSPTFENAARIERLLERIMLHEVLHVLAFRVGVLAMMQDASTAVELRGDGQKWEVGTPTMLRVAREHFGAPALLSLPLATANGSAVASEPLHWVGRAGIGELMGGEVAGYSALSALSLAFLEDVGWYHVNFSAAEDWRWGRGAGDPRGENMLAWGAQPGMCNKWPMGVPGCTFDRLSKGSCSRQGTWKQLATALAGLHLDVRRTSNSLLTDSGSNQMILPGELAEDDCVAGEPAGRFVSGRGEAYGPDSRCFEVAERDGPGRQQSPLCLRHRCSREGALEVAVGGGEAWIRCPTDGGRIDDRTGESVSIFCPPAEQLCDPASLCSAGCSGHGFCTRSRVTGAATCECEAGWGGELCDQLTCPPGCVEPRGTCQDGLCRCAPGFTGLDCRAAESEGHSCSQDCDSLEYPALCVDGRCEPRCSPFGSDICLPSREATSAMDICRVQVSTQGVCGPPGGSSALRAREVGEVGEYLEFLALPAGGVYASNGYRSCRQTAIRLACMSVFPGCDRDRPASGSQPVCKSSCIAFVRDCQAHSLADWDWCEDTTVFRPDSDPRGCAQLHDESWLKSAFKTMSVYAVFLLGLGFLLYLLYKIMRIWYLYTLYGQVNTTRECCCFVVSALCPGRLLHRSRSREPPRH